MVESGVRDSSDVISAAYSLSAWLSSKLNETTVKNISTRKRVVAACFSIALDHFDAIVVLLGRTPRIHSSAFSLVRLVFETYIRGMWLMYCATEKQVDDFSEGDFSLPKMPQMIKAIEASVLLDKNYLSNVYLDNWSNLCDYTHTGLLHVQRWNTTDAIEPTYSDEEIVEIVGFAEKYALAGAVSFAEAVIEDSELASEILVKCREVSS